MQIKLSQVFSKIKFDPSYLCWNALYFFLLTSQYAGWNTLASNKCSLNKWLSNNNPIIINNPCMTWWNGLFYSTFTLMIQVKSAKSASLLLRFLMQQCCMYFYIVVIFFVFFYFFHHFVCACVRVCVCETEICGNILWEQPATCLQQCKLNAYTLWHAHSHMHTQVYMELQEPFVEWRAVWSRGEERGRWKEVEVGKGGRGVEVKTSWTLRNRLSLCLRVGDWVHVRL